MFHFEKVRSQLGLLALSLSILSGISQAADNLGILGSHPKWAVLEKYQETITHDEFTRLIQGVYCTHGFAQDLIEINENTARILMNRKAQKFSLSGTATNQSRQNVRTIFGNSPEKFLLRTACRIRDRTFLIQTIPKKSKQFAGRAKFYFIVTARSVGGQCS